MKKTSKKTSDTRNRRSVNRTTIMIYAFVAYTLFFFGCDEPGRVTYKYLDKISPAELEPQAIHIIREHLADENPAVRAIAIEVVADTRQINLMPKVQRLLKDDFVPVRFAAALAVGDTEYSLAKNAVEQLLNDEDENVKTAAAYAMNKFGSTDNLKLIRKKLASNDQTVRANAALLLGKSSDKDSLKYLYWTMKRQGSSDKVRFQAAEAIAMIGDEEIISRLWPMLISVYADDRVMGIKGMGALGTAKAKDVLVTKLDDDVLEVRLAAAEQLGKLGDTTGEPEVLEVFTKNLTARLDEKEVEHINMLTALAIGEIGTESLTKFLPQLLKSESKLVRIAAAKAVLECTMKN